MKVFLVVPARLNSSRLPNKVLADIAGLPMLKRVLIQCKKAKKVNEIILCTPNNELANIAEELGLRVVFSDTECDSGSDRISSVLKKITGNAPLDKILIINGSVPGRKNSVVFVKDSVKKN